MSKLSNIVGFLLLVALFIIVFTSVSHSAYITSQSPQKAQMSIEQRNPSLYTSDPSNLIVSIILIMTITLAMLSLAWIGITVDRENARNKAEHRLHLTRTMDKEYKFK